MASCFSEALVLSEAPQLADVPATWLTTILWHSMAEIFLASHLSRFVLPARQQAKQAQEGSHGFTSRTVKTVQHTRAALVHPPLLGCASCPSPVLKTQLPLQWDGNSKFSTRCYKYSSRKTAWVYHFNSSLVRAGFKACWQKLQESTLSAWLALNSVFGFISTIFSVIRTSGLGMFGENSKNAEIEKLLHAATGKKVWQSVTVPVVALLLQYHGICH